MKINSTVVLSSKDAAERLEDFPMPGKIGQSGRKIFYHRHCHTIYLRRAGYVHNSYKDTEEKAIEAVLS